MISSTLLLYFLLIVPSCLGSGKRYIHFHRIIVQFGKNVGDHVPARIKTLLQSVKGTTEQQYIHDNTSFEDIAVNQSNINSNTLILSIGNTSLTEQHIPQSELNKLPRESFHWKFQPTLLHGNRTYLMISNGLPLSNKVHKNVSFDIFQVHYGAVLSAYAVLETLGFAFLHPLEPIIPPILRLGLSKGRETVEVVESPRWPERGFHLHTQHPLELTEVLQGHDIPQFGPHGPHCRQYSRQNALSKGLSYPPPPANTTPHSPHTTHSHYCERWEDMVVDVDRFFEWSIANRLNKVEWLLLHNFKWGEGEYKTRQFRFQILTHLAHQYSLLVGVDMPLGNIQQHAWTMVNVRLPFKEQVKHIHKLVDYVFASGFDFLSTESGMSEFTHPECSLMLELMNVFANYINGTHGKEAMIKVHCSTGQYCDDRFTDPRTGDPINFNFLPSLASPALGVMAHTVQVYAFDDPVDNAYGNDNFQYILDYLVYESKKGQREVVYYGETSYWVNVDIDVPLFLPIYAHRRLRDLYLISLEEKKQGFRMGGQMNFDSGWEWGYYVNNVVTARGTWDLGTGREGYWYHSAAQNDSERNINKKGECAADSQSVCSSEGNEIVEEEDWGIFSMSLDPIISPLGPNIGNQLKDLIIKLTKAQADLLIFGLNEYTVRTYFLPFHLDETKSNNVDSSRFPSLSPTPPSLPTGKTTCKKLSGLAYLSGTDTWVELPRLFGLAFTQADKVLLTERDDPLWNEVLLLLDLMYTTFQKYYIDINRLLNKAKVVYSKQRSWYEDSTDSPRPYPLESTEDNFILSKDSINMLEELADSIEMLFLRSKQVYLLYQSPLSPTAPASPSGHIQIIRKLLSHAQQIVYKREQNYRVYWERIAAWRENPTVYRYGYLWSVHSLYYWYRDLGLTTITSSIFSICYLNRMDSTEVAVGYGKNLLAILRSFVEKYVPWKSYSMLDIVHCLSPPSREFVFPKDLYPSLEA